MRSSNPMLRQSVFDRAALDRGATMTVAGTAARTFILLVIMLMPALWLWWQAVTGAAPLVGPFMIGGVITGLVLALVTVFKPLWAPVTAPLYAIAEGFAVGGISLVFAAQYGGIVLQAVAATFGVAAVMFVAYSTGLLRPTAKFRAFVIAATFALMLFYLANLVLMFFGNTSLSVFHMGWLGIGICAFAVGLAALNLILDFGFIADMAQQGAPKAYEWYGAFGLLVTLIWLYIELLRLLALLRRR